VPMPQNLKSSKKGILDIGSMRRLMVIFRLKSLLVLIRYQFCV
jgi:hypothetical protein